MASLNIACGVITMMSPGVNGGICFMDGRIVGAFIDESGARGEQAMMVLSQLSGFTCSFMPYNRESVAQDVAHVRDVITTSQPVYDQDEIKALSAISQPAPAKSIFAPRAKAAGSALGPSHIRASSKAASQRQGKSTPNVDEASPLPPPEMNPDVLIEASYKRSTPISPAIASTLFRHFMAAENLQDFLDADGKLADAPTLNKNQLKMLDIVRELSDPELFEEQAEIDLKDSRSLTEEQKKHLKAVEGLINRAEFEQETGELKFEGLEISDEMLMVLGQALASRSRAQQKAEFQEANEELEETDETVLKDFVEPVAGPLPVIDQGPRGLSDLVLPEDFQGIQKIEVDLDTAKLNPVEALAHQETYKRAAKAIVDHWKFLAPAAVALLCVLAYTIPALMRGTTAAAIDKKVVLDQTRILVNDDIRSESPRHKVQQSMPKGSVGPISIASNTAATQVSEDTSDQDAINDARAAIAEGDTNKAVAILEEALSSNPSAVDTRLELIRVYQSKKQLKRARYLAVVGFRAPGNNPSQRMELWKLYMECTEIKPDLPATAPKTSNQPNIHS